MEFQLLAKGIAKTIYDFLNGGVNNLTIPKSLSTKFVSTESSILDIFSRGAIPVMPSFLSEEEAEQLMSMADGLFMTGGADVGPDLYGEEVEEFCGEIEKDRDVSDMNLLKAAAKLKKPIFSVCR